MNNSIRLQLILFISLFLFCNSFSNNLWAAAVPVQKKVVKQKYKKQFNKFKQKKWQFKNKKRRRLKQQNDAGSTAIIAAAIAWYPISITLLILALVFMINPLLIISIILLCLPVLAAITILLILIISLATTNMSLC